MIPLPIKVTNFYDKTLQLITLKESEEAIVSEGITFLEYLYFFFSSYPEIQDKYPPGVLGFAVNGKLPTDFDVLKDGDKIHFKVVSNLLDLTL